MVLALAGDSTITSVVPPAGAGSSSSPATSSTRDRTRALVLTVFRAADFLATFFAAFFAAFLAAFFTGGFGVGVRAGDGSATPRTAVAAVFFFATAAVFAVAFLATAKTPDFTAGGDSPAPVVDLPFEIGISSVYLGALAVYRPILNPDILRDPADIREADPAVDMYQRTLHQLLKIVEVYRSGATQLYQVAPGLSGKPSALMRPLNTERRVA